MTKVWLPNLLRRIYRSCRAFNNLIEKIAKSSVLDGKTKQLLYIVMKIIADDISVAIVHVPFAKKMSTI